MNPIEIIFLIFSGLAISYLINFLSDILPLTVEETPRSLFSAPICLNCMSERFCKDFLLFKKCRDCGQPPSLRSWLVAIASPIICIFAYYYPPQGLDWKLYVIVLFYLLVVAVIDIEHRIILRSLTIAGILLSLLAGYQMHGLPITLLGFVSGAGLMGLIYAAGIVFSKWMAKQKGEAVEDALGSGDIYVSAIAGLLTAFPGVFSALLMAIVMGGFVSLVYVIYMVIRKEYQAFTPIPYAPFIIVSTIISMYQG